MRIGAAWSCRKPTQMVLHSLTCALHSGPFTCARLGPGSIGLNRRMRAGDLSNLRSRFCSMSSISRVSLTHADQRLQKGVRNSWMTSAPSPLELGQ